MNENNELRFERALFLCMGEFGHDRQQMLSRLDDDETWHEREFDLDKPNYEGEYHYPPECRRNT